MFVTPNLANRAIPQGPATILCGITVQLGIFEKYRMVSSAKVPLETKTMVALLHC
jgi:hypothetical protein